MINGESLYQINNMVFAEEDEIILAFLFVIVFTYRISKFAGCIRDIEMGHEVWSISTQSSSQTLKNLSLTLEIPSKEKSQFCLLLKFSKISPKRMTRDEGNFNRFIN